MFVAAENNEIIPLQNQIGNEDESNNNSNDNNEGNDSGNNDGNSIENIGDIENKVDSDTNNNNNSNDINDFEFKVRSKDDWHLITFGENKIFSIPELNENDNKIYDGFKIIFKRHC